MNSLLDTQRSWNFDILLGIPNCIPKNISKNNWKIQTVKLMKQNAWQEEIIMITAAGNPFFINQYFF